MRPLLKKGFLTCAMALILPLLAPGQASRPATDEILITGAVKQERTITLADIEGLPSKSIPDVPITSHAGELRGVATQLRVASVKALLQDLALNVDNPRLFSEFYLTFVASDGYKVVYSWNEIFNSPIGDSLYFIVSLNGKSLRSLPDRILILTASDYQTGRRYVKGLSHIWVRRAE